jgi:hypothetical protein
MESGDIEGEGMGRRGYDPGCLIDQKKLSDMQTVVDKNAGRYAALMWFLGVVGLFVCGCMSLILAKTSSIQESISGTNVIMERHSNLIASISMRVDKIEERNRYIDQSVIGRFENKSGAPAN